MFRKVMLFIASLAIIGVAFAIYQWRDDAPLLTQHELTDAERVPLREHTTQPGSPDQLFQFREAKIPPGEAGRVRVFDNKGNVKIAFQWKRWRSISDRRFHLIEPTARLLLPGGQLAYVWADEGEIEIQKAEGNNFNPRKGWLKGHVRIFVDRSKADWREEHADRIEPEQHPEMIVKMWLDDVDFDMDLGRLETNGPILVQSPDGMLQGRGLELVWNEANRQIKLLRILHGDRAQIRRSGVMDFGMGDEMKPATVGPVPAPAAPGNQAVAVSQQEMKAGKEKRSKAGHAGGDKRYPASTRKRPLTKREEQLQFRGLEEEEAELRRPKEDRIDTYRVEFHGDVVAEQKELARAAGRLKAAMLQLTCDVGRAEREDIQHADTQPADRKTNAAVSASPVDMEPAALDSTSYVEVRWTGELTAVPEHTRVPQTQEGEPSKMERVHLLATGSPVEILDRQSRHATCRQLEYHAETKRVWLTGTPEEPAEIVAGDDRHLSGAKVFFDRQAGLARVEGPGRMRDVKRRKEKDLSPCQAELAKEMAEEEQADAGGADISWAQSVQIEFWLPSDFADKDIAKKGVKKTQRGTENEGIAERESAGGPAVFLKHAVFEGQVQIRQSGDVINGDRVEAIFLRPDADSLSERTASMDRLIAEGNVRMLRGVGGSNRSKTHGETNSDEVTCDRLEVEMTTDDTGRNVPKVGRAFGKALARRAQGKTTREIRAGEHLEIYLASQPRPVTPQERKRMEVVAANCKIAPGSPEWDKMQARLENRRRIVTTELRAAGDVTVVMRDASDPGRNVDLAADRLNCSLQDEEDISKALVMGSQEHPATVDLGDVYAKGVQISLDMTKQTMDIPGAGRMRFMSKQDLAGRPVDRAVPVVIDWTDRMWMRGADNMSTFRGAVHAVSGGTTLDCRELRVEFQNLPDASSQPSMPPLEHRWILRPIFARGQKDRAKDNSPTSRLAKQMRKRPSYIRAVGEAVIVSAEYAKPAQHDGVFKNLVGHFLPVTNRAPPAAAPPALRGPMQSQFRVVGPQIAINLIEEHFQVEGAGNLLVEDRRLPSGKAAAVPIGSTATAAIGGLDGTGPSQTLFQWESSMVFLNRQNLAQFDRRVVMEHVSGANMAYAKEILASTNANPKQLNNIKSRQAHLTCDNLLVEFMRQAKQKDEGGSPLSGVTQLQTFTARGQVAPVLLDMDDGHRSVSGSMLSYSELTGDLRVVGSPEAPAQVMMQDERTGLLRVETDPEAIVWNQHTRKLTSMKNGRLRGTGR